MNIHSAQNSLCPGEIRVLTFTVQGVKIGVDVEQISEIMDLHAAEARGLAVYYFHEKIPFNEMPVKYRAPKAIMIKGLKDPSVVIIDNPEDLAVVNVRTIQPMPMLVAGRGKSQAFWGAVVSNEEVVLLIDFFKLPPRTALA
jgi:chemotaxis signal transduction protein